MIYSGRTKEMSNKMQIFDEREMAIFRRICTILYLITLYSLIGIQIYRQFVQHQPQEDWNDIAILITFNAIVLFGSVLYLTGSVNPKKIKIRHIIIAYLGFVLLGFAFTLFKYTILLNQSISVGQIWDYLGIVVKISALLALALGILAYLGHRRMENQIEQEPD